MKATADYRSLLAQNLKWKTEFRKRSLQRFFFDRNLSAGTLIFLLVALLALFGPLFSGSDHYTMVVTERLKVPDSAHILGTDEFGRDLLTRIVYGARVSIGIGAVVTFFASILGMVIGVYASYHSVLDHIFMRICDGMSAFPGILLAIAFTAILGASARNVIIALSIVYVPGVARVVRSAALVVKNAAFIHKSWWMVVFPGFMIIVSVLSLAMLGDGLRDFLDPRTRDAAK